MTKSLLIFSSICTACTMLMLTHAVGSDAVVVEEDLVHGLPTERFEVLEDEDVLRCFLVCALLLVDATSLEDEEFICRSHLS